MIEKRAYIALLDDFYGVLLTEKQKQALELFYDEDLSLGEIASSLKITRQAVYDLIKKSEHLLEYYEEKLGLAVKFQKKQQLEDEIEAKLKVIKESPNDRLWDELLVKWQKLKEGE